MKTFLKKMLCTPFLNIIFWVTIGYAGAYFISLTLSNLITLAIICGVIFMISRWSFKFSLKSDDPKEND